MLAAISRTFELPLLPERWSPSFEQRSGWLHQREFERGRLAKTLPALPQQLSTVLGVHRLSAEIPLSREKPCTIGLPPRTNTLRVRPPQVGVRVHGDVLVFDLVSGTGLESFGTIAGHLVDVE